MTSALIGYTGFVGSNLLRQGQYDDLYNSKNIEDIRGKSYDRIVCAGAPGEKWIANQHPDEDGASIRRLRYSLEYCSAKQFTLISTIDVKSKTAYGKHRLLLEDTVISLGEESLTREVRQFQKVNIVRLPALFGPGLKKNALYDLMHGHRLDQINPESRYQWYPVAKLTEDLGHLDAIAESIPLPIVNLVTQPISTRDIWERFFPKIMIGRNPDAAVYQDVREWKVGDANGYVMTSDQVLTEMGKFIEEERRGRTQDQGNVSLAEQGTR